MASRLVYSTPMPGHRECHVVEWDGEDDEGKPRIIREVVVLSFRAPPEDFQKSVFHRAGDPLPKLGRLKLLSGVKVEVEAKLRGG